jgi:hypothetical protein|tara:strand:+ start:3720 stop:3962 length:243 start_codon:yes stop_codon:yes gene_type:complete
MMDFTEFGMIVIHKKFTKLGHDIIQFQPSGTSLDEIKDNLKSMISLLDDGLKERHIERGIVIRSSERFPTPCTIIFNHHF